MQFDSDRGFTTEIIKTPRRFVGRQTLVRRAIDALNTPLGLMAVLGKRNVGKSSFLRQIQQMALGDYALARKAGLDGEIPGKPREYLTVYYSCDSMIADGEALLRRLCNDQDKEDGLLRLVPNEGKEFSQFRRSNALDAAVDLKLEQWGQSTVDANNYARRVEGDIVQTFRNYVNAIVTHQVDDRMDRDGLLVLIDDIDRVQDKSGLGSLIASLSSESLKFGICGVGQDLSYLLGDPQSVQRLFSQGPIEVGEMSDDEIKDILYRAQTLYDYRISFDPGIVDKIVELSDGKPYFAQLIGKACVEELNKQDESTVDPRIFSSVLESIESGRAFPALESAYQLAVGDSEDRAKFLCLLARQEPVNTTFRKSMRRVNLDDARRDAADYGVDHVDQLILRLVDERYGPVLRRVEGRSGTYEFVNPVFRAYVRLRNLD